MLRKRRQRSVDEEGSHLFRNIRLPELCQDGKDSYREALHHFHQQTLNSYIVTFSPHCVITLYYVIAILLIPLGAAVIAGSARIRSTAEIPYSDQCELGDEFCARRFTVQKRIAEPSYLYYIITNMHQNSREYVKSRSDLQLQGRVPRQLLDVTNCEPLLFNQSIARGNGFNPKEFLNPCGLTAASRFNDTFQLFRGAECDSLANDIPLGKEGIAWRTDMKFKFNAGPEEYFSDQANELLEDADFVVWMRLSAFSKVEKLYGIVRRDLEPGEYCMRINNRFPTEEFGGEKKFYITNTAWFGGKNMFLGTAYLVVGLLSLVCATVILVIHIVQPREPAERNPELVKAELAKLTREYNSNSPTAA